MPFFTPFVFRSQSITEGSSDAIPQNGLVFDLDARSKVYTDGGSTLATNGQTVQEWHTNDSGAYVFEQLTALDKPTYFSSSANFNNKPYVRFLGTADSLVEHMVAPYSVNFELQDQTIFLVARNRESVGNGSFNHFFMFGNGVTEGYKGYLGNTDGSEFEYAAGDWGTDYVNIIQSTQESYIYQMRYLPSTNLNVRLDNGTQATDTPAAAIVYTNTTSSETGFVIGAGMQNDDTIVRELSCDITRLIVYNRYVGDTERDEILTTLNTIYNTF